MTSPDQQTLSEEIDRLRNELRVLSNQLPTTSKGQRSTVLQMMWDLSGRIATANVQLTDDDEDRLRQVG